MIKDNNALSRQLLDKVSELTREIADHKIYIKHLTSQRDVAFQD
jgi:hypothetical protein